MITSKSVILVDRSFIPSDIDIIVYESNAWGRGETMKHGPSSYFFYLTFIPPFLSSIDSHTFSHVPEAFCPAQFPDVFDYPYPGIGLVPPLVAGSLFTPSTPSVSPGGNIASPLNPYVGLECEQYLYNIQTSKYEPTGDIVCRSVVLQNY